MASSAKGKYPSPSKNDDSIVRYKGNNYYKVHPDGKIGIAALHCLQHLPVNESNLHTIKHSHTVGKKPSQFKNRDFYNRVNTHEIKVEQFDVNNLYQDP